MVEVELGIRILVGNMCMGVATTKWCSHVCGP